MPARKPARPAAAPVLAQAGSYETGLLKFFPYQEESITAPWRFAVDEWARQTGKTFKGSAKCLLTCCTVRRAMCVTMSASLRQGELVIRKDAEVWRTVVGLMRKRYGQDSARPDKDKLLITSRADDDRGQLLDIDAIADLLSTGRLSAKVQWGRAADDHSLHQIFAANPDTARGATADEIFWDEAFLTPEFRECLRALRSMANRRQKARFILASSPPISSSHDSWEMLYNEDTFPVSPRGNWRDGKAGPGEKPLRIHRVDGFDSEAGGVKSYDDVGNLISIADLREQSDDKEGFDREALLKYKSSGGVLIPYSSLKAAQADGRALGGLALDLGVISDLNEIQSEQTLREELRRRVPIYWTAAIRPGREMGVGHDQSSSDKLGTSNPAALTFTQEEGILRRPCLVVRWLCQWPRVTDALMHMLFADARAAGARLKGFAVDASNDMINARRLLTAFTPTLPVHLIQSGVKHPTAGTNWKEHLGGQYAKAFVDGLYTLPPGPENRSNDWLLQDHSLAVRQNGLIVKLTSRGNHFDTGDSGALAEEILSNGSGRFTIDSADGGSVATPGTARTPDGEQGFLIGQPMDDAPASGAFVA